MSSASIAMAQVALPLMRNLLSGRPLLSHGKLAATLGAPWIVRALPPKLLHRPEEMAANLP
jgi:hypothetical protein